MWRLHYVDVLNQELVHTKSYTSTTLTERAVVSDHLDVCKQLNADVKITCHKLPTMYWIPKLHKNSYKSRFIANSSSCTTTKLSKHLTSCLIKIKEHIQRYCDKTYENSGLNLFWSIKNSNEILTKLEQRKYQACNISTYDFSTLYTTLPHNLIKTKLIHLIENTFAREKKIISGM